MLRQLPKVTDPNLLLRLDTAEDAAVYRLSADLALVQSVDFFPPMVDDPFDFGAVACANAVSDIYAKGARPLIALNIVCFPSNLPLEVLVEILRGGMAKAAEAGLVIVGGHTIEDKEPKYGLAVTGVVAPGKQVANYTALPGDDLILTKPLGMGIITTAIKGGLAEERTVARAVAVMATLNRAASEVMVREGVSACTDITGFGLLGHLREMAEGSGVGARVFLSRVPVLKEAWEFARMGLVPGGTCRNLSSLEGVVAWDGSIPDEAKSVLADAQTSGGLLMAVPRGKSQRLLAALHAAGVADAAIIGEVLAGAEVRIQVAP